MAIQTLHTIKTWFKTGLKPSQNQFWDTWDSFRHKFEKIPLKDIEELETTLDAKAENSQLEEHQNSQNAHSELFSVKENKSEKGMSGGYAPLDEFSKITSHYLNVINDLITGGETSLLSAEQGVVLQNQVDNINTLLSSDNFDLNTIQKIADVVEQIQMSLDTFLVNDLNTGGITKALTAEMGKQLNEIKLTATIATDSETQIETEIIEDNKVISRLKLFNWWKWIKSQSQTISGIWNFSNKVTLASGTASTPALIIPNGVLTTTPQNGAIERDPSGQLWETHNGIRYRLLNTLDIPADFVYNATAVRTPSLDDLNSLYPNAVIGSNAYFTKINGTPAGQVYNFRKSSLGWVNAGLVQFVS